MTLVQGVVVLEQRSSKTNLADLAEAGRVQSGSFGFGSKEEPPPWEHSFWKHVSFHQTGAFSVPGTFRSPQPFEVYGDGAFVRDDHASWLPRIQYLLGNRAGRTAWGMKLRSGEGVGFGEALGDSFLGACSVGVGFLVAQGFFAQYCFLYYVNFIVGPSTLACL